MTSGAHRIRLGRAEEIDELVAIDDDASRLYAAFGIVFALEASHPFAEDERRRWLASLRRRTAWVATDPLGGLLGFASLGSVDAQPYLDQLAVRRAAMRRGIGRALVREAVRSAIARGGRSLWLTTYDHLPFNRAFYEKQGFVVVVERECGPELLHHLERQRGVLPCPEHRVAMFRSLHPPLD